jgi:hypothetical protein
MASMRSVDASNACVLACNAEYGLTPTMLSGWKA